ncbi:hypothetical protein AAG906_017631 [Vitis piasezkii]
MSDVEDGSDEGSESEDEETPKKKMVRRVGLIQQLLILTRRRENSLYGDKGKASPKSVAKSLANLAASSSSELTKDIQLENALQSHSKAKHGVS